MNFLVHWVEWISRGSLGSDSVLGDSIQGSYKIGDYSSNEETEIYLNPLKTSSDTSETSWKKASISFQIDQRSPDQYLNGSIGEAMYYPR